MSQRPLTPEQAQAVMFPYGMNEGFSPHLVIEAGAGAGKTHVLSQRICWLLHDAPQANRLAPQELVLVTFSRAADEELRKRAHLVLDQQCPSLPIQAKSKLQISTIDALFSRLLEVRYAAWWEQAASQSASQPFTEGLIAPPTLQLASESQILERLERSLHRCLREETMSVKVEAIVYDFILSGAFKKGNTLQGNSGSRGTREDLLRALLSERLISPAALPVVFAARRVHPAAAHMLERLVSLARTEFYKRVFQGTFSYADRAIFLHTLLCLPAATLLGTPFENSDQSVPVALRPRELIVDEYQDTNELQHALLFRLATANPKGRMVVVGDPKQGIYGFRNANVEVLTRLKHDPLWSLIELRANFRSAPELLNEINNLASLTFAYRNPKRPGAFHGTQFQRMAERSFVSESALTAGRTTVLQPAELQPAAFPQGVCVLSASLNNERANEAFALQPGFELPGFQAWVLSRYLKELQGCPGSLLNWSDITVLCESNKKAKEVAEILAQCDVPALALLSGTHAATEDKDTPANRTALILMKILQGPVTALDLFECLSSPLCGVPHASLEVFFCQLKKPLVRESMAWLVTQREARTRDIDQFQKGQKGANVDAKAMGFAPCEALAGCIALFQTHRKIATSHFFVGWQTLRWNLALRWKNPQARTAAHAFCIQMDTFASGLAGELALQHANSSMSMHLELPRSLVRMVLPLEPEAPSLLADTVAIDTQSGCLKVMTVHAAKGLEWPCVVFWPGSPREMPPTDFHLLSGYECTFLKWLHADVESLSAVSRIDNPLLTEPDGCQVTGPKGSPSPGKQQWFADMQAAQEKEFERQRVFYTAFTRAREHLVLVPPVSSKRSRSGLRDWLGDVRNSDENLVAKAALWRMEDIVLAQYCDMHFQVRKPDKRGSKPLEPWFAKVPEVTPKNAENGHVTFLDFGPGWYADFLLSKASAKASAKASPESPRATELQINNDNDNNGKGNNDKGNNNTRSCATDWPNETDLCDAPQLDWTPVWESSPSHHVPDAQSPTQFPSSQTTRGTVAQKIEHAAHVTLKGLCLPQSTSTSGTLEKVDLSAFLRKRVEADVWNSLTFVYSQGVQNPETLVICLTISKPEQFCLPFSEQDLTFLRDLSCDLLENVTVHPDHIEPVETIPTAQFQSFAIFFNHVHSFAMTPLSTHL